jgi:hypothetical protein
MSEELRGGATPDNSARAARAAEAAELIAAGEIIDKPSVPPPEGFNLKEMVVVRLPDRTPEQLDEVRQELDGPKSFTTRGTPQPGGSPIHEGKKRGRRGFNQD